MKTVPLRGKYWIRAPRAEVYRILTDFESAPKYFPAVAKSLRVISRDGNNLIVEAQTKAFIGSRTFRVHMAATLHPPEGFTSTNTSAVCVEHEDVRLEETERGTKMVYRNDVEITSRFWRLLGGFLIKIVALKFWEYAYVRKLRRMLETR